MLTLAADPTSPEIGLDRLAAPGRIDVATNLGEIEQLWRSLETAALTSPYQRFDWVRAFAEAGRDIRVAVVRDGNAGPSLVLPLALERRLGIRVATAIGGKHANFQLPVAAPAFVAALIPQDGTALLRRIGAAMGADALALSSMPALWDGLPNPFAGEGQPSPSNAYEVMLERDPERTALRSMSNEARKRLRNKERGLAKLGEVTFGMARDPDGVERYLEAFFRQKDGRFRELGIPDPFADRDVRDALSRGALAGLDEGRPAIELYGLCVGGRVTAVLGGAADEQRLSGMFISFESCKEATKFSPGDILVSRTIREQCIRGRRFFDLGVGEARYKRTFCDSTVELVDVFVPVSPQGRLYAAMAGGASRAKRHLKQNPKAMALLARLRRAKAGATA